MRRITPLVWELIVEKLGVKTDLDLRNDGETFKMTASLLLGQVREEGFCDVYPLRIIL